MVLHKADTRGNANHGWLQSKHSFSFANYHNPERMHFGLLRVLNDDTVAPGMGFGTHGHQNMEIISIPLKGALSHKDSMGNKRAIEVDEVQVMSAGTGLTHSEFNDSQMDEVNFLQLWIIPEKQELAFCSMLFVECCSKLSYLFLWERLEKIRVNCMRNIQFLHIRCYILDDITCDF